MGMEPEPPTAPKIAHFQLVVKYISLASFLFFKALSSFFSVKISKPSRHAVDHLSLPAPLPWGKRFLEAFKGFPSKVARKIFWFVQLVHPQMSFAPFGL